MRASRMKGTGPRYTPSRLLLLSSHVVVSGVPRYKERLEEKAKGLLLLRIPVEWQGKSVISRYGSAFHTQCSAWASVASVN